MQKILIVDDDKDLCFLLNRFLARKGYDITVAYSGAQANGYLDSAEPDLLITDLDLGDSDGISVLNRAKELYPNLPVIIITGFSDIKTSALAMKQGAFDYVMKPLLPEQMLLTVQDALDSRKRGTSNAASGFQYTEKEIKEYYYWGNSELSKKLFRQVHLVAPTEHNVIIYGEDGSGKRSIAHEIHKLSKRSHLPFVLMNPTAIPRKNMAAAIFGSAGDSDQKGILDQANGGTILITDPQAIPMEIQLQLLQALRQRRWTREGGGPATDLDIRIFVSGNMQLWDATRQGELNQELYHRLNEFSITIPPLRERKEEIPDLVNHFLKINKDSLGTNVKGVSPEALAALKNYKWYDNIRELKNFIQKAALQCNGNYIGADCLPAEISQTDSVVAGA
ncbi:MAG: sigma-54-dependent Fis family transcriptional regulator [Chitinophagaceae bacterium]|nr:sigma-54-dependent Fis family transcriptional regulator [Chitinophagaceae bacterium]